MGDGDGGDAIHIAANSDQARIEAVTVFEDRAEVTRRVKAKLPPGQHALVVEGLTESVVEDSFRVNGGVGGAVVLEVSYRSRYIEEAVDESEVGLKRRELETVKERLAASDAHKKRIESKDAFLRTYAQGVSALPRHEGRQFNPSTLFDSVTINGVQEFMSFYSDQLQNIDEQTETVDAQIKDLKKKKAALDSEISRVNRPKSDTRREVEILLDVNGHSKDRDVSLELQYMCLGASWTASYDMRVDRDAETSEDSPSEVDSETPHQGEKDDRSIVTKSRSRKKKEKTEGATSKHGTIGCIYYGAVKNATGEDWDEVNLSLSTARPSIGGCPPTLGTMKVSYPAPAKQYRLRRLSMCMDDEMVPNTSNAVGDDCSESICESDADESEMDVPLTSATAQATSNTTCTTFQIQRLANVMSDNKPHKQRISQFQLRPRFTYFGTPKMSPHVYLKASTRNTSGMPFLPGQTAIFIDGNFISHSELKFVAQNEEFSFFLGIDEAIKLDYRTEVVSKDTRGGVLTTKCMVESHEQVTVVKNTKEEDISFILMDQLPLSNDVKIQVKLLEPDLDKNRKDDIRLNSKNNLEWRYKIRAGQEKLIRLHYRVEYPPGKNVVFSN